MNVIPVYFIILVCGIFALREYIEKNKINSPIFKKIHLFFLLSFFCLAAIAGQNFYFVYDYFYKMPYQINSCQFMTEHGKNCNFTGLFYYLNNERSKYNKIYLDKDLLFISSYAFFFNEIMDYQINNYETIDIPPRNNLIKNSIIITSETKAKKIKLENKYKLIKILDEPNRQEGFFYIFLIDNN
jgi:hypothetical protein